MNQSKLINRFARAVSTYESEAVVQNRVAEKLCSAFGNHFHGLAPRLLEIGCGTGLLTRRLMQRFAPAEFYLNDLCADMAICFNNVPRTTFLPGDAFTTPFPHNLDAILSASAVQWFPDLPAFASRCADHLAPGGMIAVSSFGPRTLEEIRTLTGEGLSYLDFATFTNAFTEKFIPLQTEQWCETLTFPDGLAVLRHLKSTGVTASSNQHALWTRSQIDAFVSEYGQKFAVPGGVRATYEPFLFIGIRR